MGVEVGGFVLERAGVGEGGGGGGEGRGGFQDLVFGSGLLELQLKPLVLLGDGEGVLLERRELGLEVFDVALFALPEGSLAVALSLCIGEENGEEGGRWSLRCTILGLAPRLGWCHVPVVFIAIAAPLRLIGIHGELHIETVVGTDARLMLRGGGFGLSHGARGKLIVIIILVLVEIVLSCGQGEVTCRVGRRVRRRVRRRSKERRLVGKRLV